MKKNRMMRLASVLLVCVLLTTSIISGTFAKYTTQDSASDTARVAKWGVALQVMGKLYGETYENAIVANDATTIRVQANDHATADDYVVAPGTEGADGFKVSLTGTPEVATQVTVEINAKNVFLASGSYGLMVAVPTGTVTAVNFATLGALYTEASGKYTLATAYAENTTYYTLEDAVDTADLGTYYPVVYALAGDTTYTGDDSADTINAIAAAIAAKFGTATVEDTISTNGNKKYTVTSAIIPVNTNLDDQFKIDDEVITWAWAFNGTTSGDGASVEDKADTILGLLMTRAAAGADTLDGTVVKLNTTDGSYAAPVEYTDYCLDTAFSIDITVNQVD